MRVLVAEDDSVTSFMLITVSNSSDMKSPQSTMDCRHWNSCTGEYQLVISDGHAEDDEKSNCAVRYVSEHQAATRMSFS